MFLWENNDTHDWNMTRLLKQARAENISCLINFALFRYDCGHCGILLAQWNYLEVNTESCPRAKRRWAWRSSGNDSAKALHSLVVFCRRLRPCVPSGLVCGVNALLSNALLSRLEDTVANRLTIGDFNLAHWTRQTKRTNQKTDNTADYINCRHWSRFS